jgi:ubiquinone/menaquinone biosynthesis C-methylase UbiE
MTSFISFGYVREGRRSDLYRRLFGYPNLLKRLQARDIMAALALKPSDRVLDIGCAYGVFTVEMARIAASAVGVDVAKPAAASHIPPDLRGRLHFLVGDGRRLPFPDRHFDVVLASEVLMMIEDPSEILRELRRVLKPEGRIVAVNGTGHPAIAEAYARQSLLLRLARTLWRRRFPPTYEAYAETLRRLYGTAFPFRPPEYYRTLLADKGFQVRSDILSPTDGAAAAVSWLLFLFYLRTGRANPFWFFETKFMLCSMLGRLMRSRRLGGQIIVAQVADAP